jgi:hypothetical protein
MALLVCEEIENLRVDKGDAWDFLSLYFFQIIFLVSWFAWLFCFSSGGFLNLSSL